MNSANKMAVIANREGLDSQALLRNAVAAWRQAGLCVVGVLAEDNQGDGICSAGLVRDIASGQAFSIELESPPGGTSCHLDASGLEHASACLQPQIAGADVVILSKFGKLESTQAGLWPVFQAALMAGKPLLTTVSPKHVESWNGFAPSAIRLGANPESIGAWWSTIT